MINFIVCEDNKVILQKNVDIINKVMFDNNLSYRIYPFSDYNEELKQIIKNSEEKKIYILDIELEDKSGIEIAREIRQNDLDSFILISTAHTEFLPYTLKSKLLVFEYLSKFDDYEENMIRAINNILDNHLEIKKIVIKIGRTLIDVKFDDIISLKYDGKQRRTIIETKTKNYKVNKPLITFTKDLDERFKKQDSATVININNIGLSM